MNRRHRQELQADDSVLSDESNVEEESEEEDEEVVDDGEDAAADKAGFVDITRQELLRFKKFMTQPCNRVMVRRR